MRKIIVQASVLGLAPFLSFQLMAQQNSTTNVSTSVSAPSQWAASVKSEISNNLKTAADVGGALTDNQLRLAYKFNDKAQLGLLFGAKYNIASDKQNQSDLAVINSDTALAGIYVAPSFIGSDKTEIDARLYFPTSDVSKKAKQNSMLRADIKLPYSLESEKVAALIFSPRFTDNAQADEKLEILSQARIGFGKTLTPYVALNHRIKMLGQTTNLRRNEEVMGPELGVEYLPHKMVKLALLVSQERNILNPTAAKASRNYSLFNDSESKYLFAAQIKM